MQRSPDAGALSAVCAVPLALVLTLALLMAGAMPAAQAAESTAALRIGSKRFTESYVLGELLRTRALRAGPAEHRGGLGNTAILLAALKGGEIDVYPEYTGTIAREILNRPDLTTPAALAGPLAALGLGVAIPLGFSDAYALALPGSLAQRLQLRAIGDLAHTGPLRLGLSQEFLNRKDGWPALVAAYGLAGVHPQGMDHGLAYDAVQAGAIDVIDAYTTDARLGRDGLVVLADPRQVIPPYEAVLLYRLGTPERFPAQWQALRGLEGRIDEAAMREANARVDLDHQGFAEAAASLQAHIDGSARPAGNAEHPPPRGLTARFLAALWSPETVQLTLQHLALVFGPVGLATVIGIPLGVIAAARRRLAGPLLAVVGILQTIPALALLALLIAVTGRIGMLPALIALFIYALLPILAATEQGIRTIDRSLRESAIALGAPWWPRTRAIEIPAARGAIIGGVRTAAVINVGGATLAAFVGAGGYGERIVSGLAVNDPALLLAGAVPAAALAVLLQLAFGWLERRLALS